MSFAAAAGIANLDLIYAGLPRLPGEGEELYASEFSIRIGGGVVGTMAALSRLGVPAIVGTYLGQDIFSGFVRGEMEALGVSWKNLYEGEGGIPLAVSVAAITPNDRTFLSYIDRQPASDRELETVYELCSGARVIEMQPLEGYLDVYRKLHQEGSTLVLDLGWDDDLSVERYRDYLALADYFTPNRKEAAKLTGEDDPEKAARRLADHFEKVIVKLDSEGCLVLEDDRPFVVKSIPDFERVDSTGAGDAFLAGLMYGLYHGRSLRQSVLYGNITGGNCVATVGCVGSLLTEEQLQGYAARYAGYLME